MTVGVGTTLTLESTSHRAHARRSFLPTGLLMLLLIASALMRFGGLDRESRWCDEYHQTSSYGASPWYVFLNARSAVQPPLDYLLGWAIHRVSPSVWAMRAPAAVFGLLSIYLTFLVVRRLADWPSALVAASMVAFSPVHFRLSQTARPYTISLFFMLFMAWSMIRALEKPDRRRLVFFGASAFALMLTRGMSPPVILLSIGLGLGVLCVVSRDAEVRARVRRVWFASIIVGVAALPVTGFLILGDQSWSRFSEGQSDALRGYEAQQVSQLWNNVVQWGSAPSHYFASVGGVIMALSGLGVVCCAIRWKKISLPGRALLATFVIAGPLFLIVYTLAVRQWPLSYRYAIFLLPFVAAMASVAVMGIARTVARQLSLPPRFHSALCLAMGLVLIVIPARATLADSQSYLNPDWRGCATYLQNRATDQDVIMVLQDRPLGEYQPTFWGKNDWPRDFNAPLAEAAWTFVTSESHWKRLVRQTGKCFVVLRYDFNTDGQNSFRDSALQAAPDGARLTKFRGLDVLELQSNRRGLSAVEHACDALLNLRLDNSDAHAIVFALLARIKIHTGEARSARMLLNQARDLTPVHLREWFDRMAAVATVD